jgi:hypothetical protein
MIDGELSTTPAEEMDGLDVTPRPAAQQTVNAAPQSAPRQASNAAPRPTQRPQAASGGPTNFPNYGRSKGGAIAGASKQDLDFYANGARRSLADPAKSNFHAKEQALLDAIHAEQRRQDLDASVPAMGSNDEPPPPGDADAPF